MPWIPTTDDPRKLSCTECRDVFPVGRSCKCQVGASAAPKAAEHDESRDSSTGAPTIALTPYEQRILVLDREADDISMELADVGARIRRISTNEPDDALRWELHCLGERRATCVVRLKKVEEDRKRAEGLQGYTDKRELPELVRRAEAAAKTLRTKGGRLQVKDAGDRN